MSKLSLLPFFVLSILNQLAGGVEFSLNDPVYDTFMSRFASRITDVEMGSNYRSMEGWKNFLKPMFEYPKCDRVAVPSSVNAGRSLSFSEVTTDSVKYSWFITMFDKSGLPDVESKAKKVLGAKIYCLPREIKKNLEDLSKLRHEIRNYHSTIYSALFIEPAFRDIPDFGKALQQFSGKKMKKNRATQIYKEAENIKNIYDDLTKRLDEKMQDIPMKRHAYLELIVPTVNRLKAAEKIETEAVKVNEVINVVDELKEKLEELRNVLEEASSIAFELSVQRPKWAEALLGESVAPKGWKLKLCCGIPSTS
ncbi:uncharacterized protein LOC116344117 [Contarinia nasturtii]|uniref:uncharacterized protein LOC116344117 n=1 Tax=Contarinia nasturtii TaxID=265458 RepID=UPI0012D3EB51|nr:uncharacterized protein LOC116344117 [Contarinia nasturtii]